MGSHGNTLNNGSHGMKSSLNEVQDKARQDAVTSTPMVEFTEPLSSHGGRIRFRQNVYRGVKKHILKLYKQTASGDVRKSNARTGTEDDHPDVKGDIQKK